MQTRRTAFRRLPTSLRWLLSAVALISVVAVAYVTYEAATLNSAWASISRVPLTPVDPGGGGTNDIGEVTSPAPPSIPETGQETGILERAGKPPAVVALVGTDSRAGLSDLSDFGEFTGQRADVIMLAIRDGDRATLLSVPRDLYVKDACHGGSHRIGEAYTRCGDRPPLANLVAELEKVMGIEIQHAAGVDLSGFQAIVDALGGYEICTDHALRDRKSGLELSAGCTVADGETTLAWLRSRHTERQVDGRWEQSPGVSDLTRNERQRTFLLDMFDRLTQRSHPAEVLDALRAAAPYVTVDDALSMTDAAAWVWQLRRTRVDTAEIPVSSQSTADGAEVLVPANDMERLVTGLNG